MKVASELSQTVASVSTWDTGGFFLVLIAGIALLVGAIQLLSTWGE